ncbi:hypothetical protein C8R43DRAFT_1127602 [Mycena crocata]|nr:hypothetical protein C8R43DRAFT_1127602 [Mycena crocata]
MQDLKDFFALLLMNHRQPPAATNGLSSGGYITLRLHGLIPVAVESQKKNLQLSLMPRNILYRIGGYRSLVADAQYNLTPQKCKCKCSLALSIARVPPPRAQFYRYARSPSPPRKLSVSCTRSCTPTASTQRSPRSCPWPSSFIESLAASFCSSGAPTPIALIHAALSTPQTRPALSAHLCASAAGNPSALMAHAEHVKELWQDMVALGLYDAKLWDALDLAWEVVLGGLNLTAQ